MLVRALGLSIFEGFVVSWLAALAALRKCTGDIMDQRPLLCKVGNVVRGV